MIDTVDIALRVATATVAGALVGLERETHGQLAGMRTHALVATGACLFTLAGAYGFPEQVRGANVDPMRVAAQVASGIGFIGAGAIIRDRGAVRGVTTAAALWASAALGVAAGAGEVALVLLGAAFVLATLVGLRALRDGPLARLSGAAQEVELVYDRGHGTLGPLMAAVEEARAQIVSLHIDDDDAPIRHVTCRLRVPPNSDLARRVQALGDRPEVRYAAAHP